MVHLHRIYTRTGDDGSTGLVDGSRRRKDDLRIEAYGSVDELNASLGLCVCAAEGDADLRELLASLQHDLFDLGADLATPPTVEGALRILPGQVDRLERAIDEANAKLGPLESFVLPGGSELAARLHLARTICRRAERLVVALESAEAPVGAALPFLNRLSDLLFVLGRVANDDGRSDVLWKPGNSRES